MRMVGRECFLIRAFERSGHSMKSMLRFMSRFGVSIAVFAVAGLFVYIWLVYKRAKKR